MPRTYKKPLGSRPYANYSAESLEECLRAIRTKQLTQRAAEKKYGIPRATIKNKLAGKHSKPKGGVTTFTAEEELTFKEHLVHLCDFGFPVGELDFRFSVKAYLDKKGSIIAKFKDNLPGSDWAKGFLKRHPELSTRVSKNIKKVRAQVSAEVIEDYMENLAKELKDVPPSQIFNYDETNLTDDPGNKRVICKRGSKYVENICNSSKSSTSVMFCGNAEGLCLPPYVVYRAEHLWSTWTENGPQNTRYNRTKSGWFDSNTFEDWFESLFLPSVKDLPGPTVMIGDNLSSHINTRVLELCERHNIRFLCLPPNTTHLTQPLDVAFFAPMKRLWRSILRKWKESKSSAKFQTIPKDIFPGLLNELMKGLKENQTQNLVSGFSKCGIYPINKQKLLERLPRTVTDEEVSYVGEAFLEQLDKNRKDYVNPSNLPRKKRKKIDISAGKSISVMDVAAVTDASMGEPGSSSAAPKPRPKKKKLSTRAPISSSEDDEPVPLESDGQSETFSDLEDGSEIYSPTSTNTADNTIVKAKKTQAPVPVNFEDCDIDNFVIVLYSGNGQQYPGKITKLSKENVTVECMVKGSKCWRWPDRVDSHEYKWGDVLCKIKPPKIKKRNQFFVPELDSFI